MKVSRLFLGGKPPKSLGDFEKFCWGGDFQDFLVAGGGLKNCCQKIGEDSKQTH